MNSINRLGWLLPLLTCGLSVFMIFSRYYPVYQGTTDTIGRIGVAGVFLSPALLARRNERFKRYWLLPFAFFTASTAMSIGHYLGLSRWIHPIFGLIERPPAGWAIDKFESSLLGFLIVLFLNRLAGQRVEALYMRRGNLWLDPFVGLPAIALMNEELIFQRLFFGRMEPLPGRFATNLVTTIPYCIGAFIFRLHSRPDHLSCPAGPAIFPGLGLVDAEIEPHLGFHPAACCDGHPRRGRDFFEPVDAGNRI